MCASPIFWSKPTGWLQPQATRTADLYFGSRTGLACGARFDEQKQMFPAASIVRCSTGGQIAASEVSDDTCELHNQTMTVTTTTEAAACYVP